MTARRAGFSLLELVIALAILSIGLVGSMRVFPVGLRASHRAERTSRAAIAAQRVIESLKVAPCATLAGGQEEIDGLSVTTTLFDPVIDPPLTAATLKGADVTVVWTQDDKIREATFVTYVRCAPGA